MKSIFKKVNKKLVVIGIDGVPFDLIDSYSRQGVMPNIRQIIQTGIIIPMAATLPEISSVSWSSFMTGVNPGKHGIFGFVDLNPRSYEFRFPGFRDLKAPPFFDELGQREMRSVIVNLPSTYPARSIPGVLISGFVVPDLKRAVYPESYFPILTRYGYVVDVDATKGKNKKMELLSDLHYMLRIRKQVADLLWSKESWDLFMFTITGTDRLHHFLFDAYRDQRHHFHADFKKYYQEIDEIIGEFYEKIEGKDEFEMIMLSDHGFVSLDQEIYINQILKKSGYFKTESREPASLEDITSDSTAFALDPSRIFLHLKEKFPRGKVGSNDYHRIRQELKELFEEYRIGSKKVIKRAYFKEEIYDPDQLDSAADIVLESYPGYDLKAGLKKNSEYGKTHFQGMHCRDNAFFFTSRPEFVKDNMSICDVKGQMFRLLDLKFEG